ncbi:NAD-dependent epimerase/dehydratase family protein [Flagellimonas algicola]|uniref:NAD-dependent epimerase/dehydratase family protein n=1 Tax=Flagellimonas algicola TaxID=2583815 RepID=A0ABY2WFR7_9FLAO|nr:NAD-dependent epimerase/dehydratase family protein [Allomuricauda algicola]TMU50389.1 NAD-dependent epimerase/dehydratase family protein [Allomuricauda algicola]
MAKVFITGANGLLGTNLCEDLLMAGYNVKGLVRNKQKYVGEPHQRLDLIEGKLFMDFTAVLEDVDYVIHVAAMTDQSIPDYLEYWRINFNATSQLFHAAIKCGVKRFIFVSTANTLGFGSEINPGSEQRKISQLFAASLYARSKWEAEQYLLEHKDRIDTIIVNPTFMIGAYDSKPSSGKIILMCWRKKIVLYPSGGKNFVHVKDVSKGIVRSITEGKNGEKYLLANENLSYKVFFKKVNQLTGQRPLMLKIPNFVLSMLGLVGDTLRRFEIKSNLSSVNMRAVRIDNYFSNKKSIRELGLDYRPVDKAIIDAVEYFKKNSHNMR